MEAKTFAGYADLFRTTLDSVSIPIIVLIMIVASYGCRQSIASNEIEYRGQKVKLTKSYADFDDYKNDPENIDPTETSRVQRLVMEAPIKREFDSELSAFTAITNIAFPGYGSGAFGEQQNPDGTTLAGFSVEIPRAGKERYFTFRKTNGRYRLIDEFVAPDTPMIAQIKLENGTLVYCTVQGERILTRPLTME